MLFSRSQLWRWIWLISFPSKKGIPQSPGCDGWLGLACNYIMNYASKFLSACYQKILLIYFLFFNVIALDLSSPSKSPINFYHTIAHHFSIVYYIVLCGRLRAPRRSKVVLVLCQATCPINPCYWNSGQRNRTWDLDFFLSLAQLLE